jgi:hypothetical protein
MKMSVMALLFWSVRPTAGTATVRQHRDGIRAYAGVLKLNE